MLLARPLISLNGSELIPMDLRGQLKYSVHDDVGVRYRRKTKVKRMMYFGSDGVESWSWRTKRIRCAGGQVEKGGIRIVGLGAHECDRMENLDVICSNDGKEAFKSI